MKNNTLIILALFLALLTHVIFQLTAKTIIGGQKKKYGNGMKNNPG